MESQVIRKIEITNNSTQITNLIEIGSYNWINSKIPRILVPGMPNIYKKPSYYGTQLKKDTNLEFIDENHFRQPSFPTESIFRAVKLCSPDFSFTGVDFVTDRNNLRKLLRFLMSKSDRNFVMKTVRRGTTVILTRVEKEDRGEGMGYGHHFEKLITKNSLPEISSFRRIVQFKLGDLTLVVRTEVDGAEIESEVDDLIRGIKNLSLDQLDWKNFENSDLQYCHKPSPTNERRKILEFKTKGSKFANQFDWEDTYLQMIIGGVQKIVVGWHNYGKIERIDEYTESNLQNKLPHIPKLLYTLNKLLIVIKETALQCNESEGLAIGFDLNHPNNLTVTNIDTNDIFPENFQLNEAE